MSAWCSRCQRDAAHRQDPHKDDGCRILADSLAFSIDEEGYPKEWVEDDSGARCTAFVEDGAEIPYRCPNTIDMFEKERPCLPKK